MDLNGSQQLALMQAQRLSRKGGTASEGVRSVERCVDILDILVAHGRSASLTELAVALGAPKSTVFTIVKTLLGRGLIAYDHANRKYRVGLGFTRYAAKAQVEVDLRDLALPHLQRLVDETLETVTLAMTDGHAVYYLCRILGSQPLQYAIPVGTPRPIHATAAGKILLAYLDSADRQKFYRKVGLEPLTERTIVDQSELEGLLRECRERGYATASGETSGDLFGLAAPIFDISGRVVAAVNMGGPLSRFSGEIQKYAVAVTAVAAAISADLKAVGRPVTEFYHAI